MTIQNALMNTQRQREIKRDPNGDSREQDFKSHAWCLPLKKINIHVQFKV